MNGVWRWIAVSVVAFVLGGGASALFGQRQVDDLEEDLKTIHNLMAEKIEKNDDAYHEIRERLIRIEVKMDTELKRHHPEMR